MAEGQRNILAHYGITEASMACPIKASMEVVEIAGTKGTPVLCDRNAWEADHIVVVGWINAHPDFSGKIESGLFKMMAIGLGKQHGAEHYHRARPALQLRGDLSAGWTDRLGYRACALRAGDPPERLWRDGQSEGAASSRLRIRREGPLAGSQVMEGSASL